MRTSLVLAALITLMACEGSIDGPIPPPGTTTPGVKPPGTIVDAGPPPCEPTKTDIPNLLRLSNAEYRNMVADVLGVPVDPALFTQWTPVAEVYGFDTMSSTRVDSQALEVQMDTAEDLARLVLATRAMTANCPAPAMPQTPACNKKGLYTAIDDFADTQGRECWSYLDSSGAMMVFDNVNSRWRKEPDQGAYLWRNGAHPGGTVDSIRRWQVPVDGTLRLQGEFASVDTRGGNGIAVSIRKNGTNVFTRDLANGGSATYDVPLTVARGELIEFVVNPKTDPSYDSTSFTASITFTQTPLKAAWNWSNCVEPIVARLASRSFRRPVRAEELAEYQNLFETSKTGAAAAGFAEPVDEAMLAVLEAVFLSPNFVFKPELVPNGLDPSERDFGLASRLSLFTRASVPDEELWMLAGTGALSNETALRAQAERLLDKDLQRFATHFGGQWLAYREAGFQNPIVESMQAESREMFAAVLSEDLQPEKLLKPGFTIVDSELARFYWLPNGQGAPPWRVQSDRRGGVLSHALFLARTGSGSEFRRPIHRGLWVMTRLLCRQLPHIDPATLEEINLSVANIDRSLPLRQQMEIHRTSSQRCGGCHNYIDPIGLALEKFDGQGNWRETYVDGTPITSDLELNGVVVRDPDELATALSSEEYRSCVATKLFTYALNRGPLEGEQCVAQRIGNPLDGSKPTLRAMTLDALMKGLQLTEVTP